MNLANIVGKITGNTAGSLVKDIGDTIGQFIDTKGEKAERDLKLQEVVNKHLEFMSQQTITELDIFMKDKDSARNMQIEALKQEDRFAKRFLYYLAGGVILLTFGFDFCMFFVHYPQENRDMINGVSGVLNTGALIMVLSFFFGGVHNTKDNRNNIEIK